MNEMLLNGCLRTRKQDRGQTGPDYASDFDRRLSSPCSFGSRIPVLRAVRVRK